VIRIAIIARSPAARAALRAMLPASDYHIAACAADVEQLEELLGENEPDAILVEPPTSGRSNWTLGVRLNAVLQNTPVIVLEPARPLGPFSATVLENNRAEDSTQLCPAAVLPSHLSPNQLRAAINAVAAGLAVGIRESARPGAARSHAWREAREPADMPELVEPLTPRERQVLEMIASGLTNKEIARKLEISDHTVKFHVAAILAKLGAGSRTEAVTMAIRHGLVLL
jgi:DNA-binding NarL/FixJ family response regulator